MHNVTPRNYRAGTLAISATVALLMLSGCGNDEQATSADAAQSAAETAPGTVKDLTDASLYEAITYARDNDLSYSVEDRSGDAVEVEDTRDFTVLEQEPESGTELRPRDSLTLVVEPTE